MKSIFLLAMNILIIHITLKQSIAPEEEKETKISGKKQAD